MTESKALIELHRLSFDYRGAPVLKEIDLQIQGGKFYGLIGGNGSGKSTLLELLMATLSPCSGSISYQGKPLSSFSRRELATRLALVPQHFSMDFEYLVEEVVLMGRHPHIPRFATPGLHDLETVHDAMDTMDILHLKERPVSALSGGELQRVVMARAMAQETEVLILDEATSNLDIQHTIAIMQVMRNRVLDGGLTIVAAIHDLNLAAAFCDECLVLKGGQLYANGPVHEIFTHDLLHEVFAVEARVKPDRQNGSPHIQFNYR